MLAPVQPARAGRSILHAYWRAFTLLHFGLIMYCSCCGLQVRGCRAMFWLYSCLGLEASSVRNCRACGGQVRDDMKYLPKTKSKAPARACVSRRSESRQSSTNLSRACPSDTKHRRHGCAGTLNTDILCTPQGSSAPRNHGTTSAHPPCLSAHPEPQGKQVLTTWHGPSTTSNKQTIASMFSLTKTGLLDLSNAPR